MPRSTDRRRPPLGLSSRQRSLQGCPQEPQLFAGLSVQQPQQEVEEEMEEPTELPQQQQLFAGLSLQHPQQEVDEEIEAAPTACWHADGAPPETAAAASRSPEPRTGPDGVAGRRDVGAPLEEAGRRRTVDGEVWGYPPCAAELVMNLEEFARRELNNASPRADLYRALPANLCALQPAFVDEKQDGGDSLDTAPSKAWWCSDNEAEDEESEHANCGSHFFWLELLYDFHSGRQTICQQVACESGADAPGSFEVEFSGLRPRASGACVLS